MSETWQGQASLHAAQDAFANGEALGALEILQHCPETERDQSWRELRGLIHATTGELPQAIALFEQLLNDDPNNPQLRINLGSMQLNAGAAEAAQATLAVACAATPEHSAAWHNLGLAQMHLRQWRDATRSLLRAAELAPQVAEPRILAARALARAGDDHAARQTLQQLGDNPKLSPSDWLQIGLCFISLRENAAALHAFAQVLAARPGQVDALLNSAALKELANLPEDAERLLAELPEAAQQHPLAGLVRARLLLRKGDTTAALAALPSDSIDDLDLAVECSFERARLLDALGQHEQAHSVASHANQGARRLRQGPPDVLDQLLAQAVDAKTAESWTITNQAAASPSPIFLLGLPRSGTTLLDVMLDGHPGLQVLSEQACLEETLRQAEARIGQPYPAALNSISDSEISSLQLLYFDSANRHLGGRQAGTQLVDKNPLNLLRLGFIRRLFPDAKIIFSERDLRDTALSCFLNDLGGWGRQGFWSLAESLEILQRLSDFFAQQCTVLGIEALRLPYEDLSADPETSLRRLCAHIGIDFDPGMLDHANTARRRGAIGTPSYQQVTQAISSDRQGRAAAYAQYFQ